MSSILGVETLQHTNGTTAATIDSGGIIKQPTKPRVMVRGRGGNTAWNGAEHRINAWLETHYNTGFTVSDGKLVVPMDGYYNVFFNASQFASSNHPNAFFILERNSTNYYMFYQFEINDYDNKGISFSMPLELQANDKLFIGFHSSYAGPTTATTVPYATYFGAYLIS